MTPALIEPNADPSIILRDCAWLPFQIMLATQENAQDVFRLRAFYLHLAGLCKFFGFFVGFFGFYGGGDQFNEIQTRLFYFWLR